MILFIQRICFFLPIISILICNFSFSDEGPPPVSNDVQNSQFIQEIQRGDLTFRVNSAEITALSPLDSSLEPALEVRFEIKNSSDTKKVDLLEELNFKLKDDFGNQYRRIDNVQTSGAEMKSTLKQLVSLYPGEMISQTVFFEIPVNKISALTLRCEATPIDMGEAFEVDISAEKIKNFLPEEELMARAQKSAELPMPLASAGDEEKQGVLHIIPPKNGTTVTAGEVVRLKITVAPGIQPPKSIFIVSPMYVFEDTALTYRYDLRIPKDYPKGSLSVVVIGRWRDDQEEHLSSDTIIFEVISPMEKCLKDCGHDTNV